MKNRDFPLKADGVLELSSRSSIEVGSARPMYHVGEPAKYLQQKQIADNESEDKSYGSYGLDSTQKGIKIQINNLSLKKMASNSKQFQTKINDKRIIIEAQKQLFIVSPSHIALTIVQIIIFGTFAVGSLQGSFIFWYIDIFGNAICGLKIMLLHFWMAWMNHKSKLKEGNNNNQTAKIYLNKLQFYELLQIWSIATTILIFIITDPVIYYLLSSIRLIRLFFPFVCERNAKRRFRAKVFGHILKIVGIIFLLTVILSIGLQLFLYNIDSYYCFSTNQLTIISQTYGKRAELISCGLNSPCESGLECRNIFEFADNQIQKRQIANLITFSQISYSNSLLYSMQATMSVGQSLYKKYADSIMSWAWLPIVTALWLLYLILTGIGIGESIRYQSLQDWKRSQQQSHKQATNKKIKNKTKAKQERRRKISNISYNSAKQLIQNNSFYSELVQPVTSTQFTAQIQRISCELKDRSLAHKLFTILFNCICLMQVLLTIADNLNIDDDTNRIVGIALGVIFIIWSFGLAFTVYSFLASKETTDRQIKANLMMFQIIAYLLMLTDYILRIVQGKYIFQQSTEVTPFAYTIISLRVVFVLYNNGYDAHISYFVQKMAQNLANNLHFLTFLLVIGASVGIIISYIAANFDFAAQIQSIHSGISIIFGSGGLAMGDSLLTNSICILLKFVAILTNFYIAKHLNIGYDSILQIDFTQWPFILRDTQSSYSADDKNLNGIKKIIISLHKSINYLRVKSIVVIVYMGLVLIFTGKQPEANIVILAIDLYLIVDIATQMIASGIRGPNSYFSFDLLIKLTYISTQILCVVFYFVDAPLALETAVHFTRAFVLFGCIDWLNQIYLLIRSIMFHPKVKIFKITIISIALLIVGTVLTSFYVGLTTIPGNDKILTSLAYSASFIYNLGWSFTSIGQTNKTLFSFCLDIIFAFLILLLHVILTFMIVTFFVNRKVRAIGTPNEEIINQYFSSLPESYNYMLVKNIPLFQYLKFVKLTIILITIVVLSLLSSNIMEFSHYRNTIAIVNIILYLIQVCGFFVQNIFIKTGNQRWNKKQAILLLISGPGTFLSIIPVSRIAAPFQISIIIRLCMFCSFLRIFRIVELLKNRSISLFSSKLLRRIQNCLQIKQTYGIFIFVVFAILPFAILHSVLNQTAITEEFLNFLTGSIFKQTANIRAYELVYKFVCSVLVLFPLRTLLLARVISSFLNNKPNQLLALRDQIGEVICESLIFNNNPDILFLPYNQMYRFSAKIYQIFEQFSHAKKVKCLKYDEIMKKISYFNIPVYQSVDESKEGTVYGILVYDLIWHIFVHSFNYENEQTNNIHTLYNKQSMKLSSITLTHIGTLQLCSFLKIKNNLQLKINQIRNKLKQTNRKLQG